VTQALLRHANPSGRGNGEKTHRHTHGRRRQQARAADLSQPRVIGWQVEAHSPAWLAAASASPPRHRETDKSRVTAARSLRLRPRQTRPERLPSRDGRFETRENYNRLFSAPECRLWVKLRRTQPAQTSSGLPLKADIAQCSRHVSNVPGAVITPVPRTVGSPGIRILLQGSLIVFPR
jgi:hypothetical protein